MKRQKLFEFPISSPLIPERRGTVAEFIERHADISDEPVTYSWADDASDILHIAAGPALVDAVFEKSKITVYLSAPSWARLLFTKAKRAQLEGQLRAALQELGFLDTEGDHVVDAFKEIQSGAQQLHTENKDVQMTAKVQAATAEANPISVLGDALESAAESIGEATSDARESAKIAAKKVKKGISAGTYHTAYGLSYGIVFSAVFLTELLPEDNVLRRGLADGAYSAIDAAAHRKVESLSDETAEHELAAADHEPALAR